MNSRYFSRSEFACTCGCGFDTIDVDLLPVLEKVRKHFRKPVKITSGCRCGPRNRKVGGKTSSQHLVGRAADIQVKDIKPSEVQEYLEATYPSSLGIGRYESFTHVDVRGWKARW